MKMLGGSVWEDPQNSSAGPALEFLGSPGRDHWKPKFDMLHKVRNSEEAGYDCAARIIQVNWRVTMAPWKAFRLAIATNLKTASRRREYAISIHGMQHSRECAFDLLWTWIYSWNLMRVSFALLAIKWDDGAPVKLAYRPKLHDQGWRSKSI